MIIGPLVRKYHLWPSEAFLSHSRQFLLDFFQHKTDDNTVYFKKLIYSPWDLPSGLLRGFVFIGNLGGGGKDAR
jgi:hypothetical protein